MVKLIALYRHPEDKESFDKHYEDVHTPLVEKMPGLKKLEVTRIQGAPMGGDAKYYLEAAMYFEDRAALDAAMSSLREKLRQRSDGLCRIPGHHDDR